MLLVFVLERASPAEGKAYPRSSTVDVARLLSFIRFSNYWTQVVADVTKRMKLKSAQKSKLN